MDLFSFSVASKTKFFENASRQVDGYVLNLVLTVYLNNPSDLDVGD